VFWVGSGLECVHTLCNSPFVVLLREQSNMMFVVSDY
jgi:hypothetical protein